MASKEQPIPVGIRRRFDLFILRRHGLEPCSSRNDEVVYGQLRELMGKASDVPVPDIGAKHILAEMDFMDSKSAALLTHVSVMIAVVAFLTPPSGAWRTLMFAEIFAFSAVAVLLLRCVEMMGPPFRRLAEGNNDANLAHYCEEVLVRRIVYQYMLRSVVFLTICLMALLTVKEAVRLLPN